MPMIPRIKEMKPRNDQQFFHLFFDTFASCLKHDLFGIRHGLVLAQEMADGKQGVGVDHARAGETHHLPDSLTIGGRVAVDGTFRTDRFAFAPGTAIQTIETVLIKITAIRANPLRNGVIFAAIQSDHRCDRFLFCCDLAS